MFTIDQVCNSRINLCDILSKRDINCDRYKNFNRKEIMTFYKNNQLDMEFFRNNQFYIYIHYFIHKHPRKTNLTNYIQEFINKKEIHYKLKNINLIIVLPCKVSNIHEKIAESFYKKYNLSINLFYIKHLEINILDHEYVPKHTILNVKEKIELKKNLNLHSFRQIPIISMYDIVVKCIGARPDDVIKITRKSTLSGKTISYRYCDFI